MGERSYPITIGSGLGNFLLGERSAFGEQERKVVAVIDEGLINATLSFVLSLGLEYLFFQPPLGNQPSQSIV